MIRTHTDVPKTARNSINCQLDKLIKKYGEKAVRLVAMKNFEESSKKRKLEEDIRKKEQELENLKRKSK